MFLVWGINLYFYLQLQKPSTVYIPGSTETTTTTTTIQENVTIIISKKCNSDLDCSWQTTNCCPETAGAYWQCINANESVIKCIGTILCPQFISPKPTASCRCQEGECVG
jgi:hypothetical protein